MKILFICNLEGTVLVDIDTLVGIILEVGISLVDIILMEDINLVGLRTLEASDSRVGIAVEQHNQVAFDNQVGIIKVQHILVVASDNLEDIIVVVEHNRLVAFDILLAFVVNIKVEVVVIRNLASTSTLVVASSMVVRVIINLMGYT